MERQTDANGTPARARRGPGRPNRISRSLIVEAAKRVHPNALTMQSVADELGVDPKALNYHVHDRGGLLEAVATDLVDQQLAHLRVEVDGDWRAACRSLAYAIRDSFAATGSLARYYRFSTAEDLGVLRPSNDVLRCLRTAGFDRTSAGRAVTLLSTVAIGFARDLILEGTRTEHPQASELRRAIEQAPIGSLDSVDEIVRAGIDPFGDEQFEFDLDVLISGLEGMLLKQREATSPRLRP